MTQVSLSIENERQLKSLVDAGRYVDVEAAMNDVLSVQLQWSEFVRVKIEEANADLEAGRYTDYDDEGLKAYFAGLKREAGISTIPTEA